MNRLLGDQMAKCLLVRADQVKVTHRPWKTQSKPISPASAQAFENQHF